MIKKIKIDVLKIEDKNGISKKTGKPYQSKKVGIQSNGIWFNGMFFGEEPMSWKQGDEVEFEVYTNEYNGKQYPNQIKLPSKETKVLNEMEDLKARVAKLEKAMPIIKQALIDLKK